MERVWVVSHERFRNDGESYSVLAAFETEQEASAAMTQYGHDIQENEYENKCSYDCMYGSTMFRIRENDISWILTQEDILRVVPVKFNTKFMAKKIIIEIGQTFSLYDNENNLISKVKCVKDIHHNDCKLCIFKETNTCDNMICNEWMRPDRENVHFEYVTS